MKKRTIYISLFLIFIIGVVSLIGTFAVDSTITEGNSSKADYLFNIVLGDRTNREVVIPSYDSKIVDIKISNPNEFNMSYLLYLEGTNSNISIINISDTEASGILNSNNTNLIKVFIQNNSSTDITVSIKDLVGFENETISLPSNATAINKGVYYKAIVKSNNNTYGKVKPNIKLSANAGTVKYNIVPNTGYQYKSTTCNGTVVDNILTISNITSNISCEVVFEPIKVQVNLNLAGGVVETTYTEPKEHTYTVPYTGTYKLEAWGAQGGVKIAGGTSTIGYGGYSVGNISLVKDTSLYVNVGGAGLTTSSASTILAGGYNGGGKGYSYSDDRGGASGGGATHIATVSGILSTLSSLREKILIVAGGGGGSDQCCNGYSKTPGSGGGYQGVDGIYNSESVSGATQTGGGVGSYDGSFGQGGNCESNDCAGGGGGYFGGGAKIGGGGYGSGGSGYIGNSLLTNKYMYCYNCTTSDATDTKTYTTTNTSSAAIANYAKSGDGAAKITIMDDVTLDMAYNDKYGDLPTPTRTDYMFDGWYTGENGTGTKVDENTVLTNTTDHTLYAKWTPLYRLDLNGYLDGVIDGGLGEYGTADVYINDVLVCDDCTDYCTQHPAGTTYLITDIKTTAGHTYNGVYSGQLSGTITDGEVKVFLNFSKNRSIPAFTYTGNYEIVDDSNNVISSPSTYVGNWKIRFLSSGTLTFSDNMGISSGIDIFVVGGGGSGATGSAYIGNNSFGGGGGGGGAAITVTKFPASSGNSYSIVVGGSKANSSFGLNGTAYFTALAGGSASAPYFTDGFVIPIPKGAGGAGRLSGQTSYYGASSVIVKAGGAGDSYGSKDSTDGNYEFNETGNKRYGAGGGSGGNGVSVNIGGFAPAPGSGGADGGGTGGKGCSYTWSTSSNSYVTSGAYGGSSGAANTGSGGGGGGSACGSSSTSYGNRGSGASGGSGIVIIRNTR